MKAPYQHKIVPSMKKEVKEKSENLTLKRGKI